MRLSQGHISVTTEERGGCLTVRLWPKGRVCNFGLKLNCSGQWKKTALPEVASSIPLPSLICLGLSNLSIRLKGHLGVLVLPWGDLILRTLHTKDPHSLNCGDPPAPTGCTLILCGPASPWFWAQHWLHHILPTSGRPCASPHRQGYLQSSGFYLPDTLRAPALGAEEEVTQGNEYMGTDKKGGRGEGAEARPQAPEEGGGDEQSPGVSQPGISHQNGASFPKGSLWPWCPHLTQPASLGRKLKPEATGVFPERPLAGWAGFSGRMAWIGGL